MAFLKNTWKRLEISLNLKHFTDLFYIEMFCGLFSFFFSRNLSYHEFSRFSLCGQLLRLEDTKCNALDLADRQNQFHHRKFLSK